MDKKDENIKPAITKRIIYVCDEGHYGLTMCGICHKDVTGHYKECPHCKAIFSKEDDIDYNGGGSDF